MVMLMMKMEIGMMGKLKEQYLQLIDLKCQARLIRLMVLMNLLVLRITQT